VGLALARPFRIGKAWRQFSLPVGTLLVRGACLTSRRHASTWWSAIYTSNMPASVQDLRKSVAEGRGSGVGVAERARKFAEDSEETLVKKDSLASDDAHGRRGANSLIETAAEVFGGSVGAAGGAILAGPERAALGGGVGAMFTGTLKEVGSRLLKSTGAGVGAQTAGYRSPVCCLSAASISMIDAIR